MGARTLLLAALLLAGCAGVRPAEAPDLVASLPELDARLERAARHVGRARDGRRRAGRAAGRGARRLVAAPTVCSTRGPAHRRRVDSPFMLASASKLATGLVVMQAVEAGRLALDAPVVPPFEWVGSPDITLRRLATHTSGIVDTDAVDGAYALGRLPADAAPTFSRRAPRPGRRRVRRHGAGVRVQQHGHRARCARSPRRRPASRSRRSRSAASSSRSGCARGLVPARLSRHDGRREPARRGRPRRSRITAIRRGPTANSARA